MSLHEVHARIRERLGDQSYLATEATEARRVLQHLASSCTLLEAASALLLDARPDIDGQGELAAVLERMGRESEAIAAEVAQYRGYVAEYLAAIEGAEHE